MTQKNDRGYVYKVPDKHQLIGNTILLRTPQIEDYNRLREILNDKVTMEALFPFFKVDHWTPEMVKERYKVFSQNQKLGTGMSYVVIQNDKIVGICGLKNIDFKKLKAAFGIILDKSVWGTSIAKECHLLCLSHAFEEMGLSEIYFNTDDHNHRMKGFFKKSCIGFKGRTKEGYLLFQLSLDKWSSVKNLLSS